MKTSFGAYAAMLGQTVLAGLSFAFARDASVEFEPFVLLLLRTLGSALFFGLIFYLRGGFNHSPKPSGSAWLKVGLLAFIGVALNQFLFLLGLKYTTPANSAVLYTLTPLIVLFISVYFFKTEQLNAHKISGAVIAIVGALLVLFAQGYSFESDLMFGNFITLGAVLSWAAYLSFGKRILPKYDSLQITATIMMLAAVIYFPIGIWFLPDFDWHEISMQAWIGFIYITFFSSALAYLLLTVALNKIDSSQASVFINAQPFVAVLFSVLAYGEVLTPSLIFGGLLSMLGILLMQRTALKS
ncbi:protein of unknown function DUF6 transmembrane [Chloroherpeton thalassium ATCC 35110]|uniref:EamA domain-containing protein n=1 Tax=Chloroherpeton thalassium (strain ATCC 35110 / GB-78) TaxID=517418 RepID=B3QSU6_CHLT3|nr:DMT family transporter [Chloroherpeton thalassium]ACF12589.1 protein of unknown function DUF6 transmembrane [Chloroherpeton thalassium ATCC 35110]